MKSKRFVNLLIIITALIFSTFVFIRFIYINQTEKGKAAELPLVNMLGRGRLGDQTYVETMFRIPQLDTGTYSVFASPCTVKVLPNTPLPTANLNEPVLKLAKNETRCFQISLKSNTQMTLPAIQITPSNQNISSKAYIEGLVNITIPTYTIVNSAHLNYTNYIGPVPDPLIPLFDTRLNSNNSLDASSLNELRKLRSANSSITANSARTLLVEVTTKKGTPSGNHTLNVTLGGKSTVLPITVYNFTLPDELKLKTSFGTGSISSAGQGFTQHKISSAQDKMTLMRDYYHEDLKWFGIDPYTPYWAEIVFGSSTGTPLRKSTLTNFYDCNLHIFQLPSDIERVLRKYVDGDEDGDHVLERRPASSFQITHLGATHYNKSDGMTICGKKWHDDYGVILPGWEEEMKTFVKAMQTYFDSKGWPVKWTDKGFYNIDEPDIGYEAVQPLPYRYRPKTMDQQPVSYKRMWLFSKILLENTRFKIGSTTTSLHMKWETDDRVALPDAWGNPIPGKYPFNYPIPANDLSKVLMNNSWMKNNTYGFYPDGPDKCDTRPVSEGGPPSYQTQCLRSNDESWFYYVGDPAFDLDSVAQDQIMMGWTSYKYRQAGVLFWSIIWWGGERPNDPIPPTPTIDPHPEYQKSYFLNPWTTSNNFYATNLSATYFYPPCGTTTCANPTYYTIPSLRLALFREGIEDYEYFYQLEKKFDRNTAMTTAGLNDASFVTHTAGWKDNPVLLAQNRANVAARLAGLPEPTPTSVVATSTPLPTATKTPTPTGIPTVTSTPIPTPTTLPPAISLNKGVGGNMLIDGSLSEFVNISPFASYADTTVKGFWNDNGIYLGFDILDDQLSAVNTPSTPACQRGSGSEILCTVWTDDSVEWFIDVLGDDGGGNDRNKPFMKADDFQGLVNINNAIVDLRGDNTTFKPTFTYNGNFRSGVLQEGTRVFIEVEIPWSSLLTSAGNTAGRTIKLGLARNDLDGTLRSGYLWGSMGLSFQNASNWRYVLISTDTVNLPTPPTPTQPPLPDTSLPIAKGTEGIIVDGNLAEYTNVNPILFSSAKVYPLWNSQGLYLGYDVTDNILEVANSPFTCQDIPENQCSVWNDDAVEWFVDTKNNRGGEDNRDTSFMRTDDYQGIVNLANTRVDLRGQLLLNKPSYSWNGKWQSETAIDFTNYTVEVFIPWANIKFTHAEVGRKFGLGLAVFDRDFDEISSTLWGNLGTSHQNASNWVEAKLSQ